MKGSYGSLYNGGKQNSIIAKWSFSLPTILFRGSFDHQKSTAGRSIEVWFWLRVKSGLKCIQNSNTHHLLIQDETKAVSSSNSKFFVVPVSCMCTIIVTKFIGYIYRYLVLIALYSNGYPSQICETSLMFLALPSYALFWNKASSRSQLYNITDSVDTF